MSLAFFVAGLYVLPEIGGAFLFLGAIAVWPNGDLTREGLL